MSADTGFRIRAKEVRAYLRSLKSLESKISPGRSFYRATATITASRAAAFLMIYNSVEFAARQALVELRLDISANAGQFDRVLQYWRQEIVRAHFYDRLRQGMNHAELLDAFASFIPGRLDWNSAEPSNLPFAGNVDHEELFRFIKRIEHKWRPPRTAVGGADLQLVRKMRNDLAHGHESFEAVGAQFTTDDITEKFERISSFMLSFLKAIENYRVKQLYLK